MATIKIDTMTRIQNRIQYIILEQKSLLSEIQKFDDTLTKEDLLRLVNPEIYNNKYLDDIKSIFYILLNFRCFYLHSKEKWVLVQMNGSQLEPIFLEDWQIKDFLSFLFQELIGDRYNSETLERAFLSLKKK